MMQDMISWLGMGIGKAWTYEKAVRQRLCGRQRRNHVVFLRLGQPTYPNKEELIIRGTFDGYPICSH
jgi:hypothetical protein